MQLSIFDILYPAYKIKNPIRLIELFAGVGSQAMALRDLGADFEHYRVVEFNQNAINSYNAIHGTNFQTTDITKIKGEDLGCVDTDKFDYIVTYSFPCQDLSIIGKQKGMKKGKNTRSGLLWEVERLLDEIITKRGELPQILLMENVPDVIGDKNIQDFNLWTNKLEAIGYMNYAQILNAKDYGVPQNRKRCFMISILGEYSYSFPKKKPLEKKLKDILEDKVDEKYFLSERMLRNFTDTKDRNGFVRAERFKPYTRDKKYAFTITTREGEVCTANYIIEDLYE